MKSCSSCLDVRLWGASAEPRLCTAISGPQAGCDLTIGGERESEKIPCGFPKWPLADLILRWLIMIWTYLTLCGFTGKLTPPLPAWRGSFPLLGSREIQKHLKITIYFNAVNVTTRGGRNREFNLICAEMSWPDCVQISKRPHNTCGQDERTETQWNGEI